MTDAHRIGLRLAALGVALAALAPAALAQGGAAPAKNALPAGPHRAADTDCGRCHVTAGWERLKPSVEGFAHALTGFPLRGAHALLTCDRCHDGSGRAHEDAGCVACHKDPHRGEQGTDCGRCHDERSFRATEALSKHRATRFPLEGAHALVECGACHLERNTNRFTGVPTECVACHMRDYQATREPNHATSGFSTQCQDCHRPTTWRSAKIFHDRFFPLRGAHAALACEACHPGGRFAGTPKDCFGCHAADYNATTNPNHAAAGFPTTCEDCHRSTTTWQGAAIDHDRFFPLTGAHATARCESCHPNGRFAGTPKDCFGCHAADYNATTNPNHAAAGFPTTCQSCHGTTTWLGATFDHDRFFPISSGKHARFRNDCTVCHPVPTNKSVFTCTNCHDRSKTDAHHRGRPGYVYQDAACYHCHPDGKGDD